MTTEPSPLKRFVNSALITSAIVSGGLVVLRLFGTLQGLELDGYDRFLRWQPDEGLDERLLVVGIDEQDIQSRQEFPIHDGTLADVITKVESYSPRMVGLDIGRDIPQGPAAGRERMIAALQASDNLIATCLLSNELSPGVPAAPGVPDDRIAFSEFPEDPGGIVRRSILVSVPGPPPPDQPVGTHLCNNPQPEFEIPSLALALAAGYLEKEGLTVEGNDWGDLVVGGRVIPRVSERYGGYAHTGAYDYQTMLHYRSAKNAVRQVNITQLLAGQVDPSWIRDRIVIIGYTSPVAKDAFTTPYLAAQENLRQMNGVVVHAQSTSQLLSAALDQRPLIWALPEGVEWGWIWGWGLTGGAIALYLRRPWLFLGGGLLLYGACVGLHFGLFTRGGWLPVVPASLALVTTALATRLVDQANRQGYTQALYEQMRAQLTQQGSAQGEHLNYLEDLVTRARAIRLAREGNAAVAPAEVPPTTRPTAESGPLSPDAEGEGDRPQPALPSVETHGKNQAPYADIPLQGSHETASQNPFPELETPPKNLPETPPETPLKTSPSISPKALPETPPEAPTTTPANKLQSLIEQARQQRRQAPRPEEAPRSPHPAAPETPSAPDSAAANGQVSPPPPFDF